MTAPWGSRAPNGNLRDDRLPPGTLIVSEEAQAATITDRRDLRRLAPFMRGECSVSQAAAELGLGLTATYKLTQRFVRLGLVQEVRRERRAGRNLLFYRAPAAFFVPFSVRPLEQMGEDNRRAELQRFEVNLGRAMRASLDEAWGTLTCFTPSGETYYEIVSLRGEVFIPAAEGAPLILSGWNNVALTQQEARELQRDLMALILPYLNREPVGEVYQIGVFMAPDNSPGNA
ncbi:ArsR/SmtB family transcription factor [Deinococcus sp. PESE-13]